MTRPCAPRCSSPTPRWARQTRDVEHETVEHGDHVDFVHDGHRHARHEDHYDEH
ncbi:hypothetical protein [Curtobacterium sp. B18]|uniref:hypothetical protein n=1 Tax=Curtobacterium sp. B18 TaxID=95614 RepID=UPI0003B36533|nr:hypothetical protein [Curtobacterium sp. B18]